MDPMGMFVIGIACLLINQICVLLKKFPLAQCTCPVRLARYQCGIWKIPEGQESEVVLPRATAATGTHVNGSVRVSVCLFVSLSVRVCTVSQSCCYRSLNFYNFYDQHNLIKCSYSFEFMRSD
jgi:hypothetical protein